MTTIAWINGEDIKSVRGEDGVERLFVDGREIPITAEMHTATQQVINYACAGKRHRKAIRAFWASLGKPA